MGAFAVPILLGVTAGVTALSQIRQGQAIEAEAKIQQRVNKIDAEGRLVARKKRMLAALASQNVHAAAGGTAAFQGSNLRIAEQTLADAELEQAFDAVGTELSNSALSIRGSNARRAGIINAGLTLVTAGIDIKDSLPKVMPEKPRFQFQPPQTGQVPATGEAQFFGNLADRLQFFNSKLSRTHARNVQVRESRAGFQAGAEGIPEMREGSTPADIAFNRAAIASYAASARTQARTAVLELEDQHPDDFEAFGTQFAGIREGMLAGLDPQLAPIMAQILDDLAGSANARIRDRFRANEKRQHLADVTEDLDGNVTEILRFARDGNIDAGTRSLEQYRTALALNSRSVAEGGTGLIDPVAATKASLAAEDEFDGEIILGQFERELRDGGLAMADAFIDRFEAKTFTEEEDGFTFAPELKDSLLTRMGVLANRERTKQNQLVVQQKAALRVEEAALDQAIDDTLDQYKLGFGLPDDINEVTRRVIALPVGNPKRAAFVRDLQSIDALVSIGFESMTPDQQAETIQQLDEEILKQGFTPARGDTLEMARSIHAEHDRRLNDDPARFYRGQMARLGEAVLPPLSDDPDELRTAMQARSQAGAVASEKYNRDVPGWTQEELGAWARSYEAAGVSEKMALLGMLADTHDPKQARLVYAELDKQNQKGLALDGALVLDAPEAAREVILGRELLAAQPDMVPNSNELEPELIRMLGTAYGFGSQRQQTVKEGIIAAYAALGRHAPEDAGILVIDRLQAATDMVTGGLLDHNGAKVVPPARGVTQGNLDAWASLLTAETFADASIGAEMALERFGNSATLIDDPVRFGPGRYGVGLEDINGLTVLLHRSADAGGGPLLLEYRATEPVSREFQPLDTALLPL